eukprot:SAG31_NODE_4232_length_3436_cov_1.384477_2_plen_64_part_00
MSSEGQLIENLVQSGAISGTEADLKVRCWRYGSASIARSTRSTRFCAGPSLLFARMPPRAAAE